MNLPTLSTQTSVTFAADPVFEPGLAPGMVALAGTATNPAGIANIEFYDGSTDLGGTGQITGPSWTFSEAFSPGRHAITALVTNLDGSAYSVRAPFAFVTGVNGEPYVFQETAQNAGVTRTSDYDASGNLVSQTAIAPGGASATPFGVSFDPTTTFAGTTEGLISGTSFAYGAAAAIEIFDGPAGQTVDPQTGALLPGAKALGAATLNGDGSWSFDAFLAPGQHVLTAVATSTSGETAVAQSSFTLVTGVTGAPYVYREIDHDEAGAVTAVTSYAADGSVVTTTSRGGLDVQGGAATGNVLRSSFDDVMTSDGQGSTTFLFTSGFGQDEITNFIFKAAQSADGDLITPSHDVVSLPQAVFSSLAQVFSHTTSAPDGSAIIHLDARDTIKIDGVTKRELIAHPNDVRLHP